MMRSFIQVMSFASPCFPVAGSLMEHRILWVRQTPHWAVCSMQDCGTSPLLVMSEGPMSNKPIMTFCQSHWLDPNVLKVQSNWKYQRQCVKVIFCLQGSPFLCVDTCATYWVWGKETSLQNLPGWKWPEVLPLVRHDAWHYAVCTPRSAVISGWWKQASKGHLC